MNVIYAGLSKKKQIYGRCMPVLFCFLLKMSVALVQLSVRNLEGKYFPEDIRLEPQNRIYTLQLQEALLTQVVVCNSSDTGVVPAMRQGEDLLHLGHPLNLKIISHITSLSLSRTSGTQFKVFGTVPVMAIVT